MNLNRTKPELDREARNNENENWERIENQNINLQKQIDTLVLESGDSSPEVAQARIDSNGNVYNTLKERLDTEQERVYQKIENNHREVTTHLSEIAQRTTHFTGIKKIKNIIPVGSEGEWDERIREVGNVIYDPDDVDKPYKLVYSGHKLPYVTYDVYVGYAHSKDGKTWVKGGKLLERASEDPYLVKHNGIYYLFVEDKEVVPFRNIRLYTSTDFVDWIDQGVVLDIDFGWESQDVSSPVVWIENNTWYMLYEGRASGQGGAIGLATSEDGLSWTKHSQNPIVSPNNPVYFSDYDIVWAESIVPDDIKKMDDFYLLTFHGSTKNVVGNQKWLPGMAISSNILDWKDLIGLPISVPDTDTSIDIMNIDSNSLYYCDETGINLAIPTTNKNFCQVQYTGSILPVTASKWTKIDYMDTIVMDSRGEFNLANATFKSKYSGVYSFRARINFEGAVDDGSRMGLRVVVNGVEAEVLTNVTAGKSSEPHSVSGEAKLFIFPGDEVEFHYYTNSETASTRTTKIMISQIG